MKTIKHLSLGMLVAFLLGGCSSDELEVVTPLPDKGGRIEFAIGIGDSKPTTKVATDDQFKSTFEAGDEIGIFAVKRQSSATADLQASGNFIHNVKIKYDGTKWNGDIYYPNSNEVLDFYAYYPYKDNDNLDPTNMSFEVQTDQSDAADFSKSDLMSAQTSGIVKGGTVNLTFEHQLAMVKINIIQGKGIPDFDDDLEVSLENLQHKATLNLKDNGVISTEALSHSIKMYRLENTRTYRALVPAQTVSGSTILFSFDQTTQDATISLDYSTDDEISLSIGETMLYRDIILNDKNVPIYQVGDPYPDAENPIGIVFETSNGGRDGKIVSLDETQLKWSEKLIVTGATDPLNGRKNMNTIATYIASNSETWSVYPAFAWVHGKNDATTDYSDPDAKGVWYLPAIDELDVLFLVYNKDRESFNGSLTTAGGVLLSNPRYWSSSEATSGGAWFVPFGSGFRITTGKNVQGRVRCVSAF